MRSSMKPALYQDLFPHILICLQKCIFNHETKQASKFQSDPSSNSQSMFEKQNVESKHFISYFLIVFCILFYTSSVVVF